MFSFRRNLRRKENGVPILSRNEIEEISKSILKQFDPESLNTPKVLDLEEFAEFYLELDIDYKDITHDKSILGMVSFSDGIVPTYNYDQGKYIKTKVYEGTIIIDNSLLDSNLEKRGRFTLCHEIGHWILHRDIYIKDKNQLSFLDDKDLDDKDNSIIKCRSNNIEKYKKEKLITDEDWLEWQADQISASLLMPEKVFKDYVLQFFQKIGYSKLNYKIGSNRQIDNWINQLIKELSNIFKVSYTSIKIRLINLGLLNTDLNNNQLNIFLYREC